MKMDVVKIRKILIRLAVLIAFVLTVGYLWEYKCVLLRSETGCSSFCEDKEVVVGFLGDSPVRGNICRPWYYSWMGR